MKKKTLGKAAEKIGKIGKVFGPAGELNLNLYDTFSGEFNTEEPLWVLIDSLAVPLFVERFVRRGQSGATVRFSDIDTSARAEQLYGLELFDGNPLSVEKQEPRSKHSGTEFDEDIYFEDIIGFRVVITEQPEESGYENLEPSGRRDAIKSREGEITAFIDSELNPLLAILSEGIEILLPAVDEYVEEIDIQNRTIRITAPPGLLELYI